MLHGKSVIAVPPGATIREQLEIRGMNQREFAKRMGMTEKHISNLINGKVELSQNVALRLESVLGVPAKFWNNLEAIYREKVARATDENELEEDISIAKEFPYSKMATLGWVPPTRKAEEKVWNLRGFFEVARLGLLEILRIPGIAYRKVGENSKSNYALAAWAHKARLDSRTILTSPVNIDKLSSVLSDIRALTLEDPESFCPKLRQLLGECGIAIVFLPHISGSFLHGATFIEGNHIVIGLTVRGRDADRFWFSLFHELCHVIDGHIFNQDFTDDPEREAAADRFARDILIPVADYNAFIQTDCRSKEAIITFAKKIGIAPGIVVGRLQKENIIPYEWYHDLKVGYTISS